MASRKKKWGIGGAVAGAAGYALLGKRGRGLISRFARSGRKGSGFAGKFITKTRRASSIARRPWNLAKRRYKYGKAGVPVGAATVNKRTANVMAGAMRKRGVLTATKSRRNVKRRMLPGTMLPSQARRQRL